MPTFLYLFDENMFTETNEKYFLNFALLIISIANWEAIYGTLIRFSFKSTSPIYKTNNI